MITTYVDQIDGVPKLPCCCFYCFLLWYGCWQAWHGCWQKVECKTLHMVLSPPSILHGWSCLQKSAKIQL